MKEVIKKDLRKFLNQKEKEGSITFDVACPQIVIDVVREFDGDMDDESFDTNGWQWDYWFTATIGHVRLSVSGSGWYGHTTVRYGVEE